MISFYGSRTGPFDWLGTTQILGVGEPVGSVFFWMDLLDAKFYKMEKKLSFPVADFETSRRRRKGFVISMREKDVNAKLLGNPMDQT